MRRAGGCTIISKPGGRPRSGVTVSARNDRCSRTFRGIACPRPTFACTKRRQ
jgi:hypothetical protein